MYIMLLCFNTKRAAKYHTPALSFPLLNRTEGEIMMKRLIRAVRLLTGYHYGQNRLNIGKINLICFQLNTEWSS